MSIVNGQTASASDFVSTSSGASDSGKVAKLDSGGHIALGFLGKGYPASVAFNGTAPTSDTDLDLSSIIGANQKTVLLQVFRTSDSDATAARVTFVRKGSSYQTINTGTAYVGGANNVQFTSTAAQYGSVVVTTDANGVLTWKSTAGATITVVVEAFW